MSVCSIVWVKCVDYSFWQIADEKERKEYKRGWIGKMMNI